MTNFWCQLTEIFENLFIYSVCKDVILYYWLKKWWLKNYFEYYFYRRREFKVMIKKNIEQDLKDKTKFYSIEKTSYRIIIEEIPKKDSRNGKYLIISQ